MLSKQIKTTEQTNNQISTNVYVRVV